MARKFFFTVKHPKMCIKCRIIGYPLFFRFEKEFEKNSRPLFKITVWERIQKNHEFYKIIPPPFKTAPNSFLHRENIGQQMFRVENFVKKRKSNGRIEFSASKCFVNCCPNETRRSVLSFQISKICRATTAMPTQQKTKTHTAMMNKMHFAGWFTVKRTLWPTIYEQNEPHINLVKIF